MATRGRDPRDRHSQGTFPPRPSVVVALGWQTLSTLPPLALSPLSLPFQPCTILWTVGVTAIHFA